MKSLLKAITSTTGQKYIMGLSGLALIGFIITHLAANALLYLPNGDAYNGYVQTLHSWGWLLYVAEIGLLVLFLVHIVTAIKLTRHSSKARPDGYRATQSKIARSKRGPSKSGFASNYMIITGLVLLVFLVLHVWQFRFGPGIDEGYTATLAGQETRDLYRLVAEVFENPLYVGGYVAVMFFLGFHLRHGFWSMFQSLGVAFPGYSNFIYMLGWLFAIAMAFGFLFIPIAMYFDLPQMVAEWCGCTG